MTNPAFPLHHIDHRTLWAVEKELQYQVDKWGADKEQSVPGYLLVMKRELDEAIAGWDKSVPGGRNSCLAEVVQVVAVGMKCLSTYGTEGCPRATNDEVSASK
jgi:hypothetical protein